MKLRSKLIGRFGNQLFQWAHLKALCDRDGHTLCCPEWVGETIFDIPHGCRDVGEHVGGYNQDQASLIYTRKQVKEWFQFKPQVLSVLKQNVHPCELVAHRRVGDLAGYGYVVVSKDSYERARQEYNLPPQISWVTEENPMVLSGLPGYTGQWLPDFYRCMTAKYLLRGNSTFSWWAAALGDGEVYSPRIDGLKGGMEQDCHFEKGNHCKFVELPNITDLHLKE